MTAFKRKHADNCVGIRLIFNEKWETWSDIIFSSDNECDGEDVENIFYW